MLQGNILQQIPVADKPPKLGGQIDYLSPEIFQSKFGFHYAETVDASEFLKENRHAASESITGHLSSAQLKAQVSALIESPRQDMAICKINDSVGYGVFALDNIPKDTVLCLYSGRLTRCQTRQTSSHYDMGYYGTDAVIATDTHRGIAGFFQHFPAVLKIPDLKKMQWILKMTGQEVSEQDLRLEDELYSIDFKNREIEKTLATENVRKEYINMNGVPVIVLVTNRAISLGEQLGFNYGYQYWLSRNIVPELFNKQGDIVPFDAYRRTFGQLNFQSFTYVGHFQNLIMQIQQANAQIKLIDTNQIQRTVDAKFVVNELQRIHAITAQESSEFSNLLSVSVSTNSSISTRDSFFNSFKLKPLIDKYKLKGSSQAELEKGLRRAASIGNKIDLKIFIKNIDNINATAAKPASQKTALDWATEKNHTECCKLLVSAGAVLNVFEEEATLSASSNISLGST